MTCNITGLKAKWTITFNDGQTMNISSARLLMREINSRADTNIRPLRIYEVMGSRAPDVSMALEKANIQNIHCIKTGKSYY